jgi:hypothetical protein
MSFFSRFLGCCVFGVGGILGAGMEAAAKDIIEYGRILAINGMQSSGCHSCSSSFCLL